MGQRQTLGNYCLGTPEQGESMGYYSEETRACVWVIPPNEGDIGSCVAMDRR